MLILQIPLIILKKSWHLLKVTQTICMCGEQNMARKLRDSHYVYLVYCFVHVVPRLVNVVVLYL